MDALRIFVVLSVLVCDALSAYSGVENEQRLLNNLFMDYHKMVIGKPVDVEVGMTLLRILDLDIDKNIVHLDVWMTYRWNDSRLRWDPEEFGDVSKVVVPTTYIWTPDITVYNSADESKPFASSHVTATVFENGEVMYVPPVKLSFYCNIKSSLRHHIRILSCPVKIGSWAYNGDELNLSVNMDKVDMSEYDPSFNNDVTLVSATAEIQTAWYECCNEPYQTANFNFTMSL